MAAKPFVFGVDLDGVVADFYGGLRPIVAEWLGVATESLPSEVSFGLEEWGVKDSESYQRLHRFAVTRRQLFLTLQPISRAAAVLRRLSDKNVRIRIITNRLFIKYAHLETTSQTAEWLEKHGIPYWDLCFMSEKSAVGADLYLDDSPSNIEALRGQGLKAIVFSNSTNRRVPPPRASSWDEVERLVLLEMKQRPAAKRKP